MALGSSGSRGAGPRAALPWKNACLGLMALLAACRQVSPETHTVPLPSPSASAVAPAPESPRRHDPRWLRAREADPMEKERLAVAVGAAGLVAGLDDGDEVAATALAALPFADDGEIALGRLGDLARAGGGRRRAVLTAILGVAGQPRQQREALDPEGARRCGEVLVALAEDAGVPREERALAVSAARALAERGYMVWSRIPSVLDPGAR